MMEIPCSVCGKLVSKKNLAVHLKIHGSASYRCHVCDKTFKTKKNLNQHSNTHRRPEDIQCPSCTAILHSKSSLIKPLLVNHEKIRYTCQFCKAEFKSIHGWFQMPKTLIIG